jgi:hypothetical protein
MCNGVTASPLHQTASGLINCHYSILPTASYDPNIPEPTTTAAPPPVVNPTGICKTNVFHGYAMAGGVRGYMIKANIIDPNGVQIGYNETCAPLDKGESLPIDSKLPWVLVMTQGIDASPEKLTYVKDAQGIEIGYANEHWDNYSSNNCSMPQNWKDGGPDTAQVQYRYSKNFTCSFQCPGPSKR